MTRQLRVVIQPIQRYRWVSRQWLFLPVVVGVVVAVGAYPLKVTVDGYTYLSSARSILTPLAGPNFYWAREPAYPIFLRAVTNLLGNSDIAVSAAQGLLMGLSVVIPGYLYLRRSGSAVSILLPFVLCVPYFVPQYFGYSSIILKQPLIGGVLVFGAVVLSASVCVRDPGRVVALILATLFGAIVAPLVSFNLKYYWFMIAVTVALVVAVRKYKVARSHRSSHQKLHLAVGLVCFVAVMSLASWTASSQGLRVWENYKRGRTEGTQLLTDFDVSEGSAIKDRLTDPLGILRGLWDGTPKLLMISPSDNPGGTKENELYTYYQADRAWICGAYDDWSYEPYSSYGKFINGSCRSAGMQGIVRAIHPHSGSFYVLCSWCLLVSPLVMLVRRNYRLLVISVAPFALIVMYGSSGRFTIDRYGQPLFPFAFAALLYILSSALGLFRRLGLMLISQLRSLWKKDRPDVVPEGIELHVN